MSDEHGESQSATAMQHGGSLPEKSPWPWSRPELERRADAEAICWIDTSVIPALAVSVSYTALAQHAGRVAAFLSRTLGGARTAPAAIGLCLDNGLAMVVCQLGALWSGHSFVPLALDPTSIRLHMRGMLEGCGAALVFCAPGLAEAVAAVTRTCLQRVEVCVIDDSHFADGAAPLAFGRCVPSGGASAAVVTAVDCSAEERAVEDVALDCASLGPEHAGRRLCTFHTSGTTGTPKPVRPARPTRPTRPIRPARPTRLRRRCTPPLPTAAARPPRRAVADSLDVC